MRRNRPSRKQFGGDLPQPVRRYFNDVARMQPPNDLLVAAVAEIKIPPRTDRFSPLAMAGFAAVAVAGERTLVLLVPGLRQVATPITPPPPSPPAPSPTMRLFDSEDIRSLVPTRTGISTELTTHSPLGDARAAPVWTRTLGLCGGTGRSECFGTTALESIRSSSAHGSVCGPMQLPQAPHSPRNAHWSQQPVIKPIELPAGGLGDGGRCAIVDWGTLADRGWCQFAVSNATFEMYIRTNTNGTDLHPDAAADLAALAVALKERAEGLATGP